MPFDRSGIIRKLKLMRAKADSTAKLGSEAEAKAFTEMIQTLVAQHQIDMAEIAPDEEKDLDPIDRVYPDYAKFDVKIRQKHIEWLENLANLVAHAHYCRLLVVRGTSRVVMVGRKSQATIAAETYLKLVDLAERLADKEYTQYFYAKKEKGKVWLARGFRTSFLTGFCSRIGQRYSDHMDALRTYYAHDQKALVALKDSYSKVDEWLKEQSVGKAKETNRKGQRSNNFDGWARGRIAADEVDLSGHKKIRS